MVSLGASSRAAPISNSMMPVATARLGIGAAGLRDASSLSQLARCVGQAPLLVAHHQQHRASGEIDRTIIDRTLQTRAGNEA
jgi:hypothetical protein